MRVSWFVLLVGIVAMFVTAILAQQDSVLVGARDIARCDDLRGAEATANSSTTYRARFSRWETLLLAYALAHATDRHLQGLRKKAI